jgi:uncharacterized membrane protein YphA (DoxX/SURF4 family)
MLNNIDRNSLGSFVLRIALGIVFLVHGLAKVTAEDTAYGATWATNEWNRAGRPPAQVVEVLEGEVAGVPLYMLVTLKNHVYKAYNQSAGARPENLKDLEVLQMIVAWAEILCSIALIIGAATQISALVMIAVQIGAIVMVTGLRGFSPPGGRIGYEYNLVLIAMCVSLFIEGGGMFSIDAWMARRKKTTKVVPEPVPVA